MSKAAVTLDRERVATLTNPTSLRLLHECWRRRFLDAERIVRWPALAESFRRDLELIQARMVEVGVEVIR